MVPLTNLRDANIDRQMLFDWTMIKFILWDVWGKQPDKKVDLQRNLYSKVLPWYGKSVKREQELSKAMFPWDIDFYGSLQPPPDYKFENARYQYQERETTKQKMIHAPKPKKCNEINEKQIELKVPTTGFKDLFRKAKAIFKTLPSELQKPFAKAPLNFQNLSKRSITKQMRSHSQDNKLCASKSIQLHDLEDSITFFVDDRLYDRTPAYDWALALRVKASVPDVTPVKRFFMYFFLNVCFLGCVCALVLW